MPYAIKLTKLSNLPRPSARITNLCTQVKKSYKHVAIQSEPLRESGLGRMYRTWRIDVCVGFATAPPMQLDRLFDGDSETAKALRHKIEQRLKPKNNISPGEAALEMLKKLNDAKWGWVIYGVRIEDSAAPERSLSQMFKIEDLKAENIPNRSRIMIFGGEQEGTSEWNLFLAARATRGY